MIILETPRLIIRNWRESDKDLMHVINNDEQVMEFFPFRRTREQSDDVLVLIQNMIKETGFGFYALESKEDQACIGFCGLAATKQLEPPFPDGTIEIGWRLAPQYWGKGYISEAASALLEYGFQEKGLKEIVSFAVPENHRSLSVMQRIGMQRDASRDFDHPRVGNDYARLRPHQVYAITNEQFQAHLMNQNKS